MDENGTSLGDLNHLPIETYWNGDVRCSIIDMFHCQKVILKEKADGVHGPGSPQMPSIISAKQWDAKLQNRDRQLQKQSWISLWNCVCASFFHVNFQIWNILKHDDLQWFTMVDFWKFPDLSKIWSNRSQVVIKNQQQQQSDHLGPHSLDEGWSCRHLADGGDIWNFYPGKLWRFSDP